MDQMNGKIVTGGNHVKTFKHSSEFVKEIRCLLGELKYPNQSKLVFQSLPKHMRRRAMSHHPKRLPKQYRSAHIGQMKKSGNRAEFKSKKKKIRDFSNKRNFSVLETHLWHAKRFRMLEIWNYKIPYSCFIKSFRACYRARRKSCLLQDISYYNYIEITGDVKEIEQKFKFITSNKLNLSINAKTYFTGEREGRLMVFKKDMYPYDYLGEITFLWKPKELDEARRTVLIWIHPSCATQISQEFKKIFGLKATDDILDSKSTDSKFENESKTVFLTELRNHFNRFRLSGPLAGNFLSKCLKPTDMFQSCIMETNNIKKKYEYELQFLNLFENGAVPNMVILLKIDTFHLKSGLNNNKDLTGDFPLNESVNQNTTYSVKDFFYSSELRHKILRTLDNKADQSDSTMNYIACKDSKIFNNEIPIMLIKNSGFDNVSWDIISPVGVGMLFWKAFVSQGAKVGGLREFNSIMLENKCDIWFPNTICTVNKKNKNSCFSTFSVPWKKLIQEWENVEENSNYFVLREKNVIKDLQGFIGGQMAFPKLQNGCLVQIIFVIKKKVEPKKVHTICLPHYKNSSKKEKINIRGLKAEKRVHKNIQNKVLNADSYKINKPCEKTSGIRIIGYVTFCEFDMMNSHTCGIAYISAEGLKELVNNFKDSNQIFIGTTSKNEYYLANYKLL